MEFDFATYLKDLSIFGIDAVTAVSNSQDATRKHLSNDDEYLAEYAKKHGHTGWLSCTDEKDRSIILRYFHDGDTHLYGRFACDPRNQASRISFSLHNDEQGANIAAVSVLFRDDYDLISVGHEKPAAQGEFSNFSATISTLHFAYNDGAIGRAVKQRNWDHDLSACQCYGINRVEYELKKGKPAIVDGLFNDKCGAQIAGKDFVKFFKGDIFKDVPVPGIFSPDDKKFLDEKFQLFQKIRPELKDIPLLDIIDSAIYENPNLPSLNNQLWEKSRNITGWVAETSSWIYGAEPVQFIEFKYLENGVLAEAPNCPFNKARIRYHLEGDCPETVDDCDPVFSGFEFLNTVSHAPTKSIKLKLTNRTAEFKINTNPIASPGVRDGSLISSYGGAKFSAKPTSASSPTATWFGIIANAQNPDDSGICFDTETEYNNYLAQYGCTKKIKQMQP